MATRHNSKVATPTWKSTGTRRHWPKRRHSSTNQKRCRHPIGVRWRRAASEVAHTSCFDTTLLQEGHRQEESRMSKEEENITQEVGSTAEPSKDTHLIVFVNGLNGNDTNWNVVVRNLRNKSKEGILMLASRSNMRLKV